MGQTTVLRDVGALLKAMLKSEVIELADDSSISFNSPAEMEETTNPQLSMFLYQVTENTQLRNYEPVYDPNTQQLMDPPVAMDLCYLFTPYAKNREDEMVLLENIIYLFHNELLFKNADLDNEDIKDLQESLAATGNENLRIVPVNIQVEELSRLWERFTNKPYKLGIAYLVTPVNIPIGTGYAASLINKVNTDVRLK